MSVQFFDKYISVIGVKPFDYQDPIACINGFETAVIKTEKCSSDDLRKLAVSTIQALYAFLKTLQRNTPLLVRIAQLIPRLMSSDLSLEMGKVLTSDQGTKIALVLLDMSATTSSALLNESDVECIASNVNLVVSAVAYCKSSNSFSDHLQKFQKQFVNALSVVYTKTYLQSSNGKEVANTLVNAMSSCSVFSAVRVDLRCLVAGDIVKKLNSNVNAPSGGGSSVPILNSSLIIELMSAMYAGDKRFNKVDLSKCMQLYIGTVLTWTKVGSISDASYMLGSGSALLESAAHNLKGQSSVWTFRMHTLLATRVHLLIEHQLANSGTADGSCSSSSGSGGISSSKEYDKASMYITCALEALKLVSDEITSENAVETASILCLDCKVLSQLMNLQGSLKYPAKLLKYTQAVLSKLTANDQCSRSVTRDLEQLCAELRLSIRLSQVFNGLFDLRDVDVHKSCFAASDAEVTSFDQMMRACTNSPFEYVHLCDAFVLAASHRIHASESLYSKLSSKYQCPLLDNYDDRALEELVLSLLETLNKGKAVLGHRLSVFLQGCLCLTLARVLHMVCDDLRAAYRWAYKALCQVDRRIGFEMQQLRLESMLMLLELYDQVGGSDYCLQYATELLMEVVGCPSQSLKNVVNYQLLRVWYRQQSVSFKMALDKFPVKRNENSIDDVTNRMIDVVNLIRACMKRDNAASHGDAPNSSFRHSHLFWNFTVLCNNTCDSRYHSFMSPENRSILLKKNQTKYAAAMVTINKQRNQSSMFASTTETQILEPLLRSLNFDVVRSLRRQLAVSSCPVGDDASFFSFLATAGSCCVSSECSLDMNSVNPMSRELSFWSDAITSVLLSDGDSAGSSARIRSRLQNILQSSKCGGFGSAGVCVAALDETNNLLYVGRMDDSAEMVIALPNKADLELLIQRWHTTTSADKQQLYNTSICEKDKVWTEEERKAWRQSRKAADQFVQATLTDLQQALGPWRVLFCGLTVGSEEDGDAAVSGVAKALFSSSLDSSRASSKKEARGKAGANAASVVENPELQLFKQDCKHWLDFVLFNTSVKPSSSGAQLSTAEAEVVITTVAQSWDPSMTAASAKELAKKVLIERFSVASAASQLTALFTPAAAAVATVPTADYTKMSAEELKDQVKKRGLKPKTTKSLNIELLTQYDAENAGAAGVEITIGDASESSNVGESDDSNESRNRIPSSVLLILDETLQYLPWENMSCLQASRCTRMPGLALLLANPLLAPLSQTEDDTEDTLNQSQHPSPTSGRHSIGSTDDNESECQCVSVKSGWAAVDINDNLEQTRDSLVPFLQPYLDRWYWKTYTGVVPPKAEVKMCHEGSNVFIYCGHGAGEAMGSAVKYQSFSHTPAAMLWGCSSGRLRPCGVYDPTGPALHYLMGGSTFVVGNLWDMTSGDLDELSMHFMRECLPQSRRGGEGRGKGKVECTAVDMGQALVQARRVCRFAYANGCAPVVYGICQQLKE